MKILSARIEDLDWQDVLDFVALRLPEGTIRDYKEDFPKDLEKTVAAMANTSGGLVIIGATEDRTTTRATGLPGIPNGTGLSERVLNICISNIAPVLVPEVAVLADPTGTRAVVVIRVGQSHQAPHTTSKNTKVYLRRGSISYPEEYATLDELEWLRKGREKSVQLRQELLERANDRFWQFLKGFHEERYSRDLARDGMLELSFCPTYPRTMLRAPPELDEIVWATRVRDYYRSDEYFPIGPGGSVLVQDGVVKQSSVDGVEWAHHTEINSFGLLFFKQSLRRQYQVNGKSLRLIRASEVFARVDEMFDWARAYFDEVGYWGDLVFTLNLENLIGSPLAKYTKSETVSQSELAYCPDPTVSFVGSTSTATIQQDKPKLLADAIKRMAWAYGWDLSSGLLDAYYQKNKGASVLN